MFNPYRLGQREDQLFSLMENCNVRIRHKDFQKCSYLRLGDETVGIYPESGTKIILISNTRVIQSDELDPKNIKKSINRFQWEIRGIQKGRVEIISTGRNSFHINYEMPNQKNIYTQRDGWISLFKF